MTTEMIKAQAVLDLLYKPDAVYLKEISSYSTENKVVTGHFSIPLQPSYTKESFGYVTAENYIRCLSQLSYVLVGFLIEDGYPGSTFACTETFNRLMVEQKMWFRWSDIHYSKNTAKNTNFPIILKLKNVKIWKAFVKHTQPSFRYFSQLVFL